MSDFPEKAPDKTNAPAVVVIGLATTVLLWAFVVYLQSYFENTQGDIAAAREARGLSAEVRDLKAAQRADLSKTTYADATKGTLKRLNIENAKGLVVRDAKGGGSLIPSLGTLNVPTIPAAAGRPADGVTLEPAAPAPAPADGATEPCDEVTCLVDPEKECCKALKGAATTEVPAAPAGATPPAAPATP